MKTRLKLNQKRSAIFFILLLVVLGMLLVLYQKRELKVDYEEVVFIRSLEKSGFSYIATVDQASNLLPNGSADKDNERGVVGVDSLPVDSGTEVFLVGDDSSTSVGDLAEKLSSDLAYTGRVFTIGIDDGKIVSIKEEDL